VKQKTPRASPPPPPRTTRSSSCPSSTGSWPVSAAAGSGDPDPQALQAHYRYLPDAALRQVCERTEITPAQIAGTSSFYAQFRRSPVGRHVVRVCHGTACHVAGAEQITEELRRHLGIAPEADTDAESRFTLDSVACLGCCSLAPVMMIEEETAGRLTPASARQALDAVEQAT
jgi:NADH:ubiquinone oxidoreductase subunit E